MAHTTVSNLFVGVPGSYTDVAIKGGIWLVPQNVVLPTTLSAAMPGSAKALGGVSDDGFTYTSTRDTNKKRDWNGDKVRSLQTSKDDSFELTFIEFLNPTVKSIIFGASNVTVVPATASVGTLISTKSVADQLDHGAYIVNTHDGVVKRRRVIPDAQPDKIDPIVEKPGELAVYRVTFDIYPDSQGVTSYTYEELNDKLVPSTWDVGITGSSGTVVYTVNSVSTSAQTYNVATASLDTAIEGLSTVGTGNAVVTGTAGVTYHIVLTNGGTLSAVGSGGATANVVAA